MCNTSKDQNLVKILVQHNPYKRDFRFMNLKQKLIFVVYKSMRNWILSKNIIREDKKKMC